MKPIFSSTTLSLALATVAITGCSGGASSGQQANSTDNAYREGLPPTVRDTDKMALVDTNVDYMLALRGAALKLTGNLPTSAEIQQLSSASNQAMVYSQMITSFMNQKEFAAQEVQFWRDTFKMGAGDTAGTAPAIMDNAPTYAAMLTVQGMPFTNVLTATSGTCPTFNASTGTFTAANCTSGNPVVGVLSDQGVMQQFISSMAFRRTRWLQETFMCVRFPAEQNGTPQNFPGGVYQNPWPFTSITGHLTATNPQVDFESNTSLICANCHATINHIAPLFGKFDMTGKYVNANGYQVITPVPGNPLTVFGDWLPAGETTAWRYMQPVADLPSLGAAVAADPGFPRCIVSRVWNWAMSRGDVVNDGTVLTDDLANPMAAQFAADNFNVRNLITRTFNNPNFVRY